MKQPKSSFEVVAVDAPNRGEPGPALAASADSPLRAPDSALTDDRSPNFGIYVHFPWCLTKCPYCDFLSVAVSPRANGAPPSVEQARAEIPHQDYADAVIAELGVRLDACDLPQAGLRSVFVGGGTPSLWDPSALARVLAALEAALRCSLSDLEVSVECNPTSLTEDHARRLIDAGVNRLSIGVQALSGERLAFLGRLHDEAGALQAIEAAGRAGVPRISADLIYGVYKQSPEAAARDVQRVLDTGITHASAYTLTIEPGTRFGALHRAGKLPLLDDDVVAHSYESVRTTFERAGFDHYEISNFAQPGQESQHNLGYWLGHDYLGLGTGAVGTVPVRGERLRYKNLLSPERYLAVWSGASPQSVPHPFARPLSEREVLDPATSLDEAILLGLRTRQGIDLSEVAQRHTAESEQRHTAESEQRNTAATSPAIKKPARTTSPSAPLTALLGSERLRAAQRLESSGRLSIEGTRLRIPPEHWLFADGIIRELF